VNAVTNKNHQVGSSWDVQIRTASEYLIALQNLMTAIVDEAGTHQVLAALDTCRVLNAVRGVDPGEKPDGVESVNIESLNNSIEFLEILIKIRASEKLIEDWLASEFHPEPIAGLNCDFEQQMGLKVDPRYDVIVLQNDDQAVIAHLSSRGFQRILRWTDIARASSSSTADFVGFEPPALDQARWDEAFSALPSIAKCAPARCWFLGDGLAESDRKNIEKILMEQIQTAYIERNTIQKWGAYWVRNFLSNVPALSEKSKSLSDLTDRFAGSGAVVVGAGPSVDEMIPWIKSQTTKPLIICAYKALKALLTNGVTPDFVVLLDPNQKLRHLEGVDTSEVAAFVTEVAVQPEVISAIQQPLLPYSAGEPTVMLANALRFPMPNHISTGGSAVHAALQFALKIGCSEITLVGCDFGFPHRRLYATGAGVGDQFVMAEDGKSFVRKPLDAQGRVGVVVEIPANNHRAIQTSLELNQYRLWTENFITSAQAVRPQTKFFNLSKDGAFIAGAPFVDAALHRAGGRTAEPREVVRQLPPYVNKVELRSDVHAGLTSQARRLRALGRTCERAARLSESGAVRANQMRELTRKAEQCPEVSLMMADELTRIEEMMRRGYPYPERQLVNLVQDTKRYCEEVGHLCAEVAAQVQISAKRAGAGMRKSA
jgi:hypothetical protein